MFDGQRNSWVSLDNISCCTLWFDGDRGVGWRWSDEFGIAKEFIDLTFVVCLV